MYMCMCAVYKPSVKSWYWRVRFVVDSNDRHSGSQPRLSEAQQKRTLYYTAYEERDKNSHYVTGLYRYWCRCTVEIHCESKKNLSLFCCNFTQMLTDFRNSLPADLAVNFQRRRHQRAHHVSNLSLHYLVQSLVSENYRQSEKSNWESYGWIFVKFVRSRVY